jgi:hypothetical protein
VTKFAQKPIALQVLSSRNSDEYLQDLHKMREIADAVARINSDLTVAR